MILVTGTLTLPDPNPGALAPEIFAATLFTRSLAASRAFYSTFLGTDPVYEDDACAIFRIGPTMVNLLHSDQASDLVSATDVARSGTNAVYTLQVANVDAESARLTALGLPLYRAPEDRPWGIRTASFADPSGHVWELSHPLPEG